jgi:hypothetical protein
MTSVENRLRWYVGLERAAAILAFIGLLAIAVGALCVSPVGLANPKAISSLFAVLAASGSLVHEGRNLLEIGCLLLALAGAITLTVRAKFRAAPQSARQPP